MINSHYGPSHYGHSPTALLTGYGAMSPSDLNHAFNIMQLQYTDPNNILIETRNFLKNFVNGNGHGGDDDVGYVQGYSGYDLSAQQQHQQAHVAEQQQASASAYYNNYKVNYQVQAPLQGNSGRYGQGYGGGNNHGYGGYDQGYGGYDQSAQQQQQQDVYTFSEKYHGKTAMDINGRHIHTFSEKDGKTDRNRKNHIYTFSEKNSEVVWDYTSNNYKDRSK